MNAQKSTAISIVRKPSQGTLASLGVTSWPIWTKEVSEFPWFYEKSETCYFLTGEVVVIPDGGEAVQMGEGNLVTFPAGMQCTWKIVKDVRKHYRFG